VDFSYLIRNAEKPNYNLRKVSNGIMMTLQGRLLEYGADEYVELDRVTQAIEKDIEKLLSSMEESTHVVEGKGYYQDCIDVQELRQELKEYFRGTND
jgi:hypothetical protein